MVLVDIQSHSPQDVVSCEYQYLVMNFITSRTLTTINQHVSRIVNKAMVAHNLKLIRA